MPQGPQAKGGRLTTASDALAYLGKNNAPGITLFPVKVVEPLAYFIESHVLARIWLSWLFLLSRKLRRKVNLRCSML